VPVWEAQFVLVIASKTGWKETFIRWCLPLSRAFPYYHAARLLEGENCRWPHRSTSTHDPAAIRAKIRAAAANFTTGQR
jgi:hypothetical protein